MVWQKAYAVPVGNSVIDDHAFSVRQTHDGGYVVGGDVIVWGYSAYLPFRIQLYSYAWVLGLTPRAILYGRDYSEEEASPNTPMFRRCLMTDSSCLEDLN